MDEPTKEEKAAALAKMMQMREDLDKIEEALQWALRGIVGLFVTSIVAAILKYILGI